MNVTCDQGYSNLDDVYTLPAQECLINTFLRLGLYAVLLTLSSAILISNIGIFLQRGFKEARAIIFPWVIPHHFFIAISSIYILSTDTRWIQDIFLLTTISLAIAFGVMSYSSYLFDILRLSLQAKCTILHEEKWSYFDRLFTAFVIVVNCVFSLLWFGVLLHLHGTLFLGSDSEKWITYLWVSVTFIIWLWAIGLFGYGYNIIRALDEQFRISSLWTSVGVFTFLLVVVGCGGLLLAFVPWLRARSCYCYCLMGSTLSTMDVFRLYRRYKRNIISGPSTVPLINEPILGQPSGPVSVPVPHEDIRCILQFPSSWLCEPRLSEDACRGLLSRDTLQWLRIFNLIPNLKVATRLQGMEIDNYGGYSLPQASSSMASLWTRYIVLWLLWDDMVVENIHTYRLLMPTHRPDLVSPCETKPSNEDKSTFEETLMSILISAHKEATGKSAQEEKVPTNNITVPANLCESLHALRMGETKSDDNFTKAWAALGKEMIEDGRSPDFMTRLYYNMHMWIKASMQESEISRRIGEYPSGYFQYINLSRNIEVKDTVRARRPSLAGGSSVSGSPKVGNRGTSPKSSPRISGEVPKSSPRLLGEVPKTSPRINVECTPSSLVLGPSSAVIGIDKVIDEEKASSQDSIFTHFLHHLYRRTITIGMFPACQLLEYACACELTEKEYNDKRIMTLQILSGVIVSIANEIYSIGKDFADNWINVVLVRYFEQKGQEGSSCGDDPSGPSGPSSDNKDMDLRQHIQYMCKLNKVAIALFDDVARKYMKEEHRPEIGRWIQKVRYCCAGFSLWHSLCKRYRNTALLEYDKDLYTVEWVSS